MQAFLIIKPGPYSTIQDAGRPGLRRYGIPPSGAMDQYAFRFANLLVGNSPDAAAIEVTMPGLVVEALSQVLVAITGGDLSPQLNNQPAPLWTALTMQPGDQLGFKQRTSGCRAYLAIRGAFEATVFLGSKSTFLKGRMGALLKENDVLSTGGSLALSAIPRGAFPQHLRPPLPSQHTVRVILGAQLNYFTPRGVDTFLQSAYSVSPRSDRQGFRTEGPPIEFVNGSDIISEPTPIGAIQVPGDGKPIILHREGQVTGGYAKIGNVIAADLDKFGQMVPGDMLHFQAVTRDEALVLARRARQELTAIAAMIEGKAPLDSGSDRSGAPIGSGSDMAPAPAQRSLPNKRIWKPPPI